MTLNKFLTIAIALFSLAAASFWFWSSLIEIPPNQDTFVSALQQASRFSSYAAGSAAVAAICQAILFYRRRNETRFN